MSFDPLRRFLVYALTYILGFVAALAIVAAATQLETTAWMPLAVGLFVMAAIGLLPPFRNIVLRLPVGGLFASGALAAWFLSEPTAASEPNERFTLLLPILGAMGPAACGLLLLLLSHERRTVSRAVWFWTLALVVMCWLTSFFSSSHNLAGTVLVPHPSFRYSDEFAAAHNIPERPLYQAVFFCVVTVVCVALAKASRATRAKQTLFVLSVPTAFVLYDEFRNTIEFTDRVSKRNLALDICVICVTAVIGLLLIRIENRRSGNERISVNSGNNQ